MTFLITSVMVYGLKNMPEN